MLVCTLKVMVFYFNLTRIKKDNKIIRTGLQNNSRVGYISMEPFLRWRTVILARIFLWSDSSLFKRLDWNQSNFSAKMSLKTSFSAKLSIQNESIFNWNDMSQKIIKNRPLIKDILFCGWKTKVISMCESKEIWFQSW